jgi:hypothetical protein
LGIGDWGLGPIPNPQSPIPQSPIPNKYRKHLILKINLIFLFQQKLNKLFIIEIKI